MRILKRMAALLMTAALTLAMSATAFAAEGDTGFSVWMLTHGTPRPPSTAGGQLVRRWGLLSQAQRRSQRVS